MGGIIYMPKNRKHIKGEKLAANLWVGDVLLKKGTDEKCVLKEIHVDKAGKTLFEFPGSLVPLELMPKVFVNSNKRFLVNM